MNNVVAKLFVKYCSSSAVSYSFYLFSVVYDSMNEYWRRCLFFLELGFPSTESWFVSFVNKPNRLCVSIFVSGVMICVLCFFFLLVLLIACQIFLPLFCVSSSSSLADVNLCDCRLVYPAGGMLCNDSMV